MKNTLLGFIAVSLVTVSCKKDEKATYIKEETSVQSNAVVNTPQPSILDQAGISSPAAASIAAPGMNPAHGQPGHRCDIPVGQPLNSQAAPAQNVAVNTVPNAVQVDPNALPAGQVIVPDKNQAAKTAPGMNPPHGQPGHRCDIPVGQPLSSKPAPQATPTNIQPTPVPAPQQALAMGEKPKLNPAHGEPFHSCSLKVGEPLP